MKKAIPLICFLFAVIYGISQPKTQAAPDPATLQTPSGAASGFFRDSMPAPQGEDLTLVENEYDFGKIPQGKPVTHVFVFKNTGNLPLALDRVQASCGCTTPEWNKDTIPPGATSKITVGYNAQNDGPFAKPVTITYGNNQVKQIVIKGDVWKTPLTSAPLNNTVKSLTNEQ